MSNDPKDAVVDLSKLMRSQAPTSTPTSIPTIPVGATNSMITNCNEGTNMIGHELSTLNEQMIGHENFSRDDEAGKKKPD